MSPSFQFIKQYALVGSTAIISLGAGSSVAHWYFAPDLAIEIPSDIQRKLDALQK